MVTINNNYTESVKTMFWRLPCWNIKRVEQLKSRLSFYSLWSQMCGKLTLLTSQMTEMPTHRTKMVHFACVPKSQGALSPVGRRCTVQTSLLNYCSSSCEWFVSIILGKTTLVVMFSISIFFFQSEFWTFLRV
mgnify:CR=1 FL=1